MAIEVVERKTALLVRVSLPEHRRTYILSGNDLSEWEAYLSMLEKLTEKNRNSYHEAASMLRWLETCHGEVAGVKEDDYSLIFTFTFENTYDAGEFERGLALNLSQTT